MKSRGVWLVCATVAVCLPWTAPARAVEGAPGFPSGADAIRVVELVPPGADRKGDAAPASPDGMASVIVQLAGEPLAAYAGGVPGLTATSPAAVGGRRLEFDRADTRAYLRYLADRQESFLAAARAAVPGLEAVNRYSVVFNGVSLRVPADRVAELASLPGVAAVHPDQLLQPDTDRTPAFIGAPALWTKLGGQLKAGQGVVVGIIDTGVWPEHPSFADPDPGGISYPAPPATWSGSSCAFGSIAGDAVFTCNNKLLAAYRMLSTHDFDSPPAPTEFLSARDQQGHGTHTASTAAGNRLVAATVNGAGLGDVSGVAPRAHVAVYKVCEGNTCWGSDSLAAVERAVSDGVDVINFSIGGGKVPFDDPVEMGFLNAYAAGVFVATSAGNEGTVNSVAHRGPWVTTVAATSMDREFRGSASVSSSNAAPLVLTGASLTGPLATPAAVVYAGGDHLCQAGMPAVAPGSVVICDRGINARIDKSHNAALAGAAGMILRNTATSSADLAADLHEIPSIHIDSAQGDLLMAYLANTSVQATLSGGAPALGGTGDVTASFSSRGGSGQVLGVSKPDLAAPGVNVLAGTSPAGPSSAGGLFEVMSGTSMASPHVAGAAALLRDLYPTWTPGMIKSALMTTAVTLVTKSDGATPADVFDVGSGRIDLSRAFNPGLTFDAAPAQFLFKRDTLWEVNAPSVFVPVLPGKITVNRTARSVLRTSSTWKTAVARSHTDFTVKVPASLLVGAGKSKTFPITIDASQVPLGATRFAVVTLKGTLSCRAVQVRIPVTVVRGAGDGTVSLVESCSPSVFFLGNQTSCDIDVYNDAPAAAYASVADALPAQLQLVPGSVVGGTATTNGAKWAGTLQGARVSLYLGGGNGNGYVPLSLLSVPPTAFGDDQIKNTGVYPFIYAGRTYTQLGVCSNGMVVAGGGTSCPPMTQSFPDPAAPNNVIAPFWTDLDPSAGGAIRIARLASGPESWIVVDWENVPRYAGTDLYSFQVWIGVNGTEEITFTYGRVDGSGSSLGLTIGAENPGGRAGDEYAGLPTASTVFGVRTVTGHHRLSLAGKGVRTGAWTNCASMLTDVNGFGYAACVAGTVNP